MRLKGTERQKLKGFSAYYKKQKKHYFHSAFLTSVPLYLCLFEPSELAEFIKRILQILSD